MSSCCTLRATGEPGSCGVCGERGKPVPRETLEHLLKPEKRAEIIDQPYYFCETPECDIVYFTDLPLHYFDKDDLTEAEPAEAAGSYREPCPGIDDPLRREQTVQTELETRTFKVSGITCADCVLHIADSVRRLPGAHKVSGNLTQNTVKVRFEPDKVSVDTIIQAIERAGYKVDAVEV